MDWKAYTGIAAIVALIALTWFLRGAIEDGKERVVVEERHDTLYTPVVVEKLVPYPVVRRDTLWQRDTVGTIAPALNMEEIFVAVDTTIGNVSLDIVYMLPTPAFPLGVFEHIGVVYPARLDSIVMEVRPDIIVPWWTWPVVVGALLVGLLLGKGSS